MTWLKKLFKKKPLWIYGTVEMPHGIVSARKHRIKGNVQFVLWKAGEQGHKEDFWHDMHTYWWKQFKTDQP